MAQFSDLEKTLARMVGRHADIKAIDSFIRDYDMKRLSNFTQRYARKNYQNYTPVIKGYSGERFSYFFISPCEAISGGFIPSDVVESIKSVYGLDHLPSNLRDPENTGSFESIEVKDKFYHSHVDVLRIDSIYISRNALVSSGLLGTAEHEGADYFIAFNSP